MDEPTASERFSKELAWVALGIGVLLGNAGAVKLVQALSEGPSFGAEDAETLLQVFLVTLPLTIGAVLFCALAFSDHLGSGQQPIFILIACLAGGAAIGTVVGSVGAVDLGDAATWEGGFFRIPWTFLTAYYQLYGFGYFFSSILLGVFFGKWAAWLATRPRAAAPPSTPLPPAP